MHKYGHLLNISRAASLKNIQKNKIFVSTNTVYCTKELFKIKYIVKDNKI